MKLFEIATRRKYRFEFKGFIGVEELWDLNVDSLDVIFKKLNARKKEAVEESLLKTKTKESEEVENKIEIIKYIVDVKLKEKEKIMKSIEVKKEKEKILEAIKEKKEQGLKEKTEEELIEMLNKLEG